MYSPVLVRNPTSKNHTVMLHPNQQVHVKVADVSILTNDCQAQIESDMLELDHEVYCTRGKTFVFRQKYDLTAWSKVSTTFLGHIKLPLTNGRTPVLSCYLGASNEFKRDIVTVVNPADCTVKIYPHQILEVVLFMPVWGQDLSWNYNPLNQNNLVELCSSCIDPTIYKLSNSTRRLNDAFFTYPRMVQSSGVSYQEHHWWFRLNPTTARLISSLGEEYPPSILSFTGHVNGQIRICQAFKVVLNDRPCKNWEASRSLEVSFEDSAMDKGLEDGEIQPFILPSLRTKVRPKAQKKQQPPRRYYDYPALPSPQTSVVPEFQKQDVMVFPKNKTKLSSGCRVYDPLETSQGTIWTLPTGLSASSYSPDELAGHENTPASAVTDMTALEIARFKSQWKSPVTPRQPAAVPAMKATYYFDGGESQWD